MKFAVASLAFAATAYGASSSLIPSGISSGCATFLDQLNSNTDVQNCIKPLIAATKSFSPTSGSTPPSSQIDSTLKTVCAVNSTCADTNFRGQLNQFKAACASDLSSNKDVLALYDVLYVVTPLRNAVCSIDSATQKYCVDSIAATTKAPNSKVGKVFVNAGSSALDYVQQAVQYGYSIWGASKREFDERAATSVSFGQVATPNATTYQDTNLPFLFLQASMSQSALCTPCTRGVFVSYIKWETQNPYAIGLANSPILGGQNKLFSAVNKTCGASFAAAIQQEAGSGNAQSGGAGQRAGVPAMATLALGALAFVLVA